MTVNVIQLLMMMAAIILLSQCKYGLRYICLFMLPFQSMGIFYIDSVTTQIIALQLTFLVLFLGVLYNNNSGSRLSVDTGVSLLIITFPFIVSIIYNTLYFEPIEVWEVEVSRRGERGEKTYRNSLNFTNVTQHIYVVFAFLLTWVYSSIRLDSVRVKKILDMSIWAVVFISIVQVLTWYLDVYNVYEILFYTIPAENLKMQVVGFMKRINSSLVEPSYFGIYASTTLFFYLAFYGYERFVKSWAVRALLTTGLISTVTSFYFAIVFLFLLIYLFYSKVSTKLVLYALSFILIPLVFYFISDFVSDYLHAKRVSHLTRFHVSWTMAWDAFYKSPIFGYAYGTTKSFFIYTQMLTSIGVVGCLILVLGILRMIKTKSAAIYVLAVVLAGLGNFEFTRPEMWVYFGLLCNPYLRPVVTTHTRTPNPSFLRSPTDYSRFMKV